MRFYKAATAGVICVLVVNLIAVLFILFQGYPVAAEAADPTPTPTHEPAPLFLKVGNRVQCQLDNGYGYSFTIKNITDEWVYTMDAQSADFIPQKPMWIRINALSACWFN